MFLYKQVYLSINKEIRNSLTDIYGIGRYKAMVISTKIGFSFPFSINNLNYYYFKFLTCILDGFTWLEMRIKRVINTNVTNLIEINCYKGIRHRDRLPCRGQRTRTNASTMKNRYPLNLE